MKKLEKGEITRRDAVYEVENYWVGALRKAVQEGDVNYGSLMAGQSVGLINEIKPVKKIIEDLVSEAEQTFDKLFAENK